MDSIVKPLLTQVKAVNLNYDQIVQQLSAGDPAAKDRIRTLATETRKLFANFKEKIAHMKSSVEMSPGFVPNIGVMIKMLMFFIKEVIAVIQLFLELMKLINNIFSLKTVIDWIMKDLIAAQKWLAKKKLWVTRAINRVKQKVTKNIEWIKRKVTLKVNEVLAKAQLKYYTKLKEAADKSLSKATSELKPTGNKVKDKVAELAEKKKAEQRQRLKQYYNDKVREKQAEVDSFPGQYDAIQQDKEYWNKRWSDEAAKDRKELLDDIPGINKNV